MTNFIQISETKPKKLSKVRNFWDSITKIRCPRCNTNISYAGRKYNNLHCTKCNWMWHNPGNDGY